MRCRYSTESRFAGTGRWLRREARSWGGVVAVAVACSLLASSARAAEPAALTRDGASGRLVRADTPAPLAQLEARAAKLSKQYRGQLEVLSGAETAAEAGAARMRVLDRQLAAAHRQLARLAAASYMDSAPDQALAVLTDGDPQQVLGRSAAIAYLAQQRDAREQQLHRLTVAGKRAERAAQAKVDGLRQMVATLADQQQRIKRLLARFQPQSPIIGDNISRACDFMLSSGGVMPAAASIQKGYDIAAWAQANAARLGIMYIIYRQRIWDVRMESSGWVPMEDRGSITANHYDHVHISVF